MKQIFFRAKNAKIAGIFGNLGTVQQVFPGSLGDMGHRWCITISDDDKVEAAMETLKANPDIQYVEIPAVRKLIQ